MYLELSNTEKRVKICRFGFSLLKKFGLVEGWRLHSHGYAVLQFSENGGIHTLYLQKLLAEHGSEKPSGINKKLFVRMINGDKLDCRLSNLEWTTMSGLRRQESKEKGFRGVSKDGSKYRAVLYDNGSRIYLGTFDTADEAAMAYDAESYKRFGITNSLNFKLEEEHLQKISA